MKLLGVPKWIIFLALGVIVAANLNNDASWSNVVFGLVAAALIILGLSEWTGTKNKK